MRLSLLGRAAAARCVCAPPPESPPHSARVRCCGPATRVLLVGWAPPPPHPPPHPAAGAPPRGWPPPRRDAFARLGGLDGPIACLRRAVVLPLSRPGLFAAAGVAPPRGVLLWGAPGTGKTALAKAAAAEAGAALVSVSCCELQSGYAGEGEARLGAAFAAAAAHGRALLLLDGVDALARLAPCLGVLLDACVRGVVVVATAHAAAACPPALRRPGRLDAEVEVLPPSGAGRAAALRCALARSRASPLLDAPALAAALHGFTGADCCALVAAAAMGALRRCVGGAGAAGGACVTPTDLAAARARVRPSLMRLFRVEAPPRGDAAAVAGCEGLKAALVEVVEWPLTRAPDLARLGVAPPRGVLLFGPPGCAKTCLARAAAAASGRNFISAAGPDLLSAFVGESEKAVAALFARARAAAPCVLLLDEVDALAPPRATATAHHGAAGSGATERVIAQLLAELDGGAAGGAGCEGVALLATTNRPDRVDPALLRPGRIDRLLYVPPPGSAGERHAVLAAHTQRTPLGPDVDLRALAERTLGFTGADCGALCREAAFAALGESFDATTVDGRHFDAALRVTRPSPPVDPHLAAVYARLRRGAT